MSLVLLTARSVDQSIRIEMGHIYRAAYLLVEFFSQPNVLIRQWRWQMTVAGTKSDTYEFQRFLSLGSPYLRIVFLSFDMSTVLVTVGTTRFDALIETLFTPEVQGALHSKGYQKIVIQSGHSEINWPDPKECKD